MDVKLQHGGRIKFEIILPPEANPIAWMQLSESEVLDHRFLNCHHYITCLSHAAGRQWQGFTCIICKVWEREKERKNE